MGTDTLFYLMEGSNIQEVDKLVALEALLDHAIEAVLMVRYQKGSSLPPTLKVLEILEKGGGV